MVLYCITLAPLEEELRAADPGLLLPLYVDGAAFDGSARRSAQLLNLLMKRRAYRRIFPEPDKYLLDTPGREEAAKRGFAAEGLILNFVSVSWYLGAYLGPRDQL